MITFTEKTVNEGATSLLNSFSRAIYIDLCFAYLKI